MQCSIVMVREIGISKRIFRHTDSTVLDDYGLMLIVIKICSVGILWYYQT